MKIKSSNRMKKNAQSKTRKQSTITQYFRIHANDEQHERPTGAPAPLISSSHFVDKQHLPIYYNNVRSIVNKRNISMKIELSQYKVLCFTETFLDDRVNFNFPDPFNVYRRDRANAERNSRTRRASGVAVLVHKTFRSQSIELSPDPNCEFLSIEINLKPKSLIIYLCYMSIFESNIANKHFYRIKTLIDTYKDHRIIILGDFNLKNIAWEQDELNNCYLPTLSTTSQSQYFVSQMIFSCT